MIVLCIPRNEENVNVSFEIRNGSVLKYHRNET